MTRTPGNTEKVGKRASRGGTSSWDIHEVSADYQNIPEAGKIVFELGDDHRVLDGRFVVPCRLDPVGCRCRKQVEHDHLVACEILTPTKIVDDDLGIVQAIPDRMRYISIPDLKDLFNVNDDSSTSSFAASKRDEQIVPDAFDTEYRNRIYLFQIQYGTAQRQ